MYKHGACVKEAWRFENLFRHGAKAVNEGGRGWSALEQPPGFAL